MPACSDRFSIIAELLAILSLLHVMEIHYLLLLSPYCYPILNSCLISLVIIDATNMVTSMVFLLRKTHTIRYAFSVVRLCIGGSILWYTYRNVFLEYLQIV